MGAGWMELEHRAFGFPFPPLRERLAMLAEQVEIVHRQWTEEHVSFSGAHYTLEDCPALPKPVQRPHPPILVGGRAKPGTANVAARFADEYNVIGATRDEYAEARRSLDNACERAGRDPKTLRMSIMTGFLLGADEDALLAHARATLERWGSELAPEELVARQRAKGTAGTPEELAEGLRSLEDVGVERAMLQHIRHDDLETVALLGRDVVPKLGK
jgi:alkanesulfonate monooxygenase SsuD/methylene tetrahydromethanopterin reductase-like flavin-dependent oxidoreductase (luciferase family)